MAPDKHQQRTRPDEADATNGDAGRPAAYTPATPTLARIHLNNPSAASALAKELCQAECFVARHSAGTVDVLIESSAVDDVDQARMELAFFLKAWADDHPGIEPHVVW